MHAMLAVLRRELGGYFATPVAYVFIVIFLVLSGWFTFAEGFGSFFARGQADLNGFFQFLPWLYLFLIPALSMRLWAEERRGGTIELLMTLPVPGWAAVVGKFLAAWLFTIIALVLTGTLWVTVDYLGEPDHSAILTSYIGSALLAGAFLSIGSTVSALTKSQIIAFVISVVVCLVLLLAGYPPVQGFITEAAPAWVAETVASLGFLTHFQDFSRGVVNLPAVFFFVSLMICLLIANTIIIDIKKAD